MRTISKECEICGKAFEGVGGICPDCCRSIEASATSNSLTLESSSGLKEIQNSRNEKSPKSIKDCKEENALIGALWNWAENVEKLGVAVMAFLLLGGLAVSWLSARSGTDELSVPLMLAGYIPFLIYSVIAYVTYHVIALLLSALAQIVHSTRTTARLAEYKALQEEKKNAE